MTKTELARFAADLGQRLGARMSPVIGGGVSRRFGWRSYHPDLNFIWDATDPDGLQIQCRLGLFAPETVNLNLDAVMHVITRWQTEAKARGVSCTAQAEPRHARRRVSKYGPPTGRSHRVGGGAYPGEAFTLNPGWEWTDQYGTAFRRYPNGKSAIVTMTSRGWHLDMHDRRGLRIDEAPYPNPIAAMNAADEALYQ